MRWWWLSFADVGAFRGAAIVQGATFLQAAQLAHARGINPGGEIAGYEIEAESMALVPHDFRHVLMSRVDCDNLEAIVSAAKNNAE